MSVEALFKRAVEYSSHFSEEGKFTDEQKLKLYGLFKQGTEGACTTAKPGFTEYQASLQWQTWKKLGNMSRNDSQVEYIQLLNDLCSGWQTWEGFDNSEILPSNEEASRVVNSSFEQDLNEPIIGEIEGDHFDTADSNNTSSHEIKLKLNAIAESVSEDRKRLAHLENKMLHLAEKALTRDPSKAEPQKITKPMLSIDTLQKMKEELTNANNELRKELQAKEIQWKNTEAMWNKRFDELQRPTSRGGMLTETTPLQYSIPQMIEKVVKFLENPLVPKVAVALFILYLIRRRFVK